MADNQDKKNNDLRLVDIVRESKIAAADKQDVVVDMKEADKARLQLLAEELRPVFEDVDKEDDRFDFSISSGAQPRLWIDSVTHIHMGRDRRTFRFVRDSRLGRVVVSEEGDIKTIARDVSKYIADRVVEREKILEGDMESFKDYYARMTKDNIGSEVQALEEAEGADDLTDDKPSAEPTAEEPLIEAKRPQSEATPFLVGVVWFILGSVLGLALAFNYHQEIFDFLSGQ